MATPSAAPRTSLGYQPALDGVRALSVIAVLLFHGEVPFMTGGYLGVSVFFTLSGFLITSLLVHERERTGRVAVGAFYARRARRLLPASILCVGLVVVLAASTDWFAGVTELRRQVIGSLLQVANWVFLAGEGSYQDLFQESVGSASPLEHYWSLAIEEQFYWVWPIAFVGLVALAPTRRAQTWLLGGVAVLFALSAPFTAAVWGGDAAYWATPARVPEILAGALLAVVLAGRTVPARSGVLAPVALVALVAAFVLFPASGGPAYSGALPLVGVVSAALLLGLQVEGPVRQVLGTAPMAWLGRISYGVYLYHWPIFVVLDERRSGLDGVPLLAARLALTLAVAQVSFTLFETPIRQGRGLVPRRRPAATTAASTTATTAGSRRTFAYAGGATVVAVVATFVLVPASDSDYWTLSSADAESARIRLTDEPLEPLVDPPDDSGALPSTSTSAPPAPTTPATAVPAATIPAGTSSPASTVPDATTPDSAVPATTTPATTTPATTTPPPATTTIPSVPELSRPVRIVVAGDSTADASGVGLVTWAAANPELAQVDIEAEPGCGFVRGGAVLVDENWRPVPERCEGWLDDLLPSVTATTGPDVVMLQTTSWDVLDHRWETGERFSPLDPELRGRIERDFASVTDRLLDEGAGTVVWVMQPVPNPLWLDLGQSQSEPARHEVLYAVMHELAAERPGRVEVVDLAGWLDETGQATVGELRPDGVHWTPEASTRLAEEYLGEQLVRAALGLPRP